LKGFYQGFGGINGPWDLTGGTADLQYYFSRDKFSPYAVVAAGGMNLKKSVKHTSAKNIQHKLDG
jgi:OOP family OmpA-OmpF porin